MPNQKVGVLLVNLGTPDAPTPSSVRRFLKAFLSDKRVVDLPRLLWLPILYLFILTFRAKKVAANYQKIWTDQGSPLMAISLQQQAALQEKLATSTQADFRVELAMTYGAPSIEDSASRLNDWGAEKIIVLPLYPQFSHTTTSSVFDQIEQLPVSIKRSVQSIADYCDQPSYIRALADSIQEKMNQSQTKIDKLIFSFHGIPKRYVTQGDPYQVQCEKTANLLAAQLDLPDQQWEIAYQSRLGREEWLTPYLDERLSEIADQGVENVMVVCPGFSADCLETLEEIAMENKSLFLNSGGRSYSYVEALNQRPLHIAMMAELVTQHL